MAPEQEVSKACHAHRQTSSNQMWTSLFERDDSYQDNQYRRNEGRLI